MGKITLLSYSLKYKYLNSFIKTGYKTFSCYHFDRRNSQESTKTRHNNSKFQVQEIKIPSKYLKLLINRNSKIRWKWLNMLSGVVSVSMISHYDFNFRAFLAEYAKNYNSASDGVVFGFFYRKIYISWRSALWLENLLAHKKSKLTIQLREDLIMECVQKMRSLTIFGPVLLMSLLKKIMLKVLLMRCPAADF